MKREVRQLSHNLWDGLWFVPGIFAASGLLVGLVLSGFLNVEFFGLLQTEEVQFDTALVVNVLVGLAGALITVAGVVFSMTMVVLSSTTAQFGPRLLGDFLQRMTTKLAVGGFLAAFLFQVLIALGLAMGKPVSGLVVLVSVFSSLLTFCLLLVFIHLVARFIRVPFLINDVANHLKEALIDFNQSCAQPTTFDSSLPDDNESGHRIRADNTGYIQVVEAQELLKLASERDGLVQLLRKAGDFVTEGDVIAVTYDWDEGKNLSKEINGLVSLGTERTAQQDVGFALHQLVEIATKALSPGINDPWTASTVIDRIEGALAPLSEEPFPAGLWYSEDGKLRLAIPVPRVSDILSAAYHSIRQFGYEIPSVAFSLVGSYRRMSGRKLHPDFAISLSHHLEALAEDVARANWNTADRSKFEERYRETSKVLAKQLPGNA